MSWHSLTYNPLTKEDLVIRLPVSKSVANRLLVLQYLSKSSLFRIDESHANDIKILHEILANDIPTNIDCQDAGTVLRFMTCLCSAIPGKQFILKGTPRLLERPMTPLLNSLKTLGAQIEQVFKEEALVAYKVTGQQLQNADLTIAGDVSSQFISGLCLISPLINDGLSLAIAEPILSKPYIQLTLKMLEDYGISFDFAADKINIPRQTLIPQAKQVETDWSSATFFYAYMILDKQCQKLNIHGLDANDLQGDKFISELCIQFGIETTFNTTGATLRGTEKRSLPKEIDLGDYPDLAVPIIVSCAFRYPEIRFTGLSHLRTKESDRIYSIQQNLENFDIVLKEDNGAIWLEKGERNLTKTSFRIETFADHRIAMSFSLLAALGYEIMLDNTSCVAKSFPGFFEQISQLGIQSKKSII